MGNTRNADSVKQVTQEVSCFKECTSCGIIWETRDAFLSDAEINLVGYQVNLNELVAGWFLFNHSCRTTVAISAGEFQSLYAGPIYEERLTGTDECPEYCLRQDELRRCPARCECAWVREILQIVKNWPKHSGKR